MPLGMARESGLHRKRMKVSGRELAALSALPRPQSLKQQAVPLTGPLLQGFTQRYLWSRFDEPKPTPVCHLAWWEWYCGPEEQKALAAPRGHAKTSVLTHAGTLASMLFRNRAFGVLGGATWPAACEFLAAIASELMENEDLQRDFEIRTFERAREDDLIVVMRDGHKFRLMARGIDQPIRGLKWGSKRPDLFNLDDIEDDEAVESKDRREKLSNRVMNSLMPAGSDNAIIRLYGTVMHYDSFLENCLKDPQWHGLRYKAHRGYDDFTDILWEEKFSRARLWNRRQLYITKGNPDGYAQEYLNEPVSEQDSYFRRTDLLPIEPETLRMIRDGDLVLKKYAGWDAAFSKDERRDYSVCVVVGVDQWSNKYVVDIRRGRWDTKEFVDELHSVEREHKPEWHGMEKGSHYLAIQPYLDDVARRTNRYPNFYPVGSHKDKRIRAKVWQGAVKSHHVFFDTSLAHYSALEDEMVRFPKGEHDDIVDAQTIIGRLLEDMTEGPTDAEVADEDEALHEAQELHYLGHFGGQSGRDAVTGY